MQIGVVGVLLYLFLLFSNKTPALPVKKTSMPVAVVVPHHNVVQNQRLEFLRTVGQKRPDVKKVVLLSPDHFSPKQMGMTYADRTWKLSNGELQFAESYRSLLVLTELNNGVVLNDHGITNILPDIKEVWPNARVVPILIGQQMPFDRLNPFISELQAVCKEDCLLITSVDFSHYLPYALADVHDAHTMRRLAEMTIPSPKDIEVDSPQALYVLTEFAKKRNAFSWNLHLHTNSTSLENNRDAESTGHIMGWYENGSAPNREENSTYTFIVARDIDQARDIKLLGERFFYGTDVTDFNFQTKKCFGSVVCFTPDGDATHIRIPNNNDDVELAVPSSVVVAGVIREKNGVTLVLLPTKLDYERRVLLRGKEKTDALDAVFKQFPQNKICHQDVWNGVIECAISK